MKATGICVALAFVLCGCGGSGRPGKSTPRVTVSSLSSEPASTGAGTASTPVTTPDGTPVVHLSSFRSPSGNIGCTIVRAGARCDIRSRAFSPPPRPAGCSTRVDFGHGVTVAHSGRGRFVCAADTTLDPSAKALPFGTDAVLDGVICQSSVGGITCTVAATAHGFFVSIQRYRIF